MLLYQQRLRNASVDPAWVYRVAENDGGTGAINFVKRRQWLEKQEKAFQIWLNALLTPQAAAPEDDGGLVAKRLHARVRGQIWHMYCSDPGVIGVMTRLEKRVDEGFLRMKAEVCSQLACLLWPGIVNMQLPGPACIMSPFLRSASASLDSVLQCSVNHETSSLLAMQASRMGDVRLKQHISEVLAAYHPFWLRLGLEIVVGKAVPCAAGSASRLHRSRAELDAFAREHFLNDADLALQRAGNRALGTLHGDVYWVYGHSCSTL